MQFIKKLVIMTGSGARGTLMLEKNGYGVWGKLSLFDLPTSNQYKLVIISGDDLLVKRLDGQKQANFQIGEMSFDALHAAVVGEDVVMYGSNCAAKMTKSEIMAKVGAYSKMREQTLVTFSGRQKNIDDYFKQIAPPLYNDFAVADKNYYPAYVEFCGDEDEQNQTAEQNNASQQEQDKGQNAAQEQEREQEMASEQEQTGEQEEQVMQIENENEKAKVMPYQLERRYLATIIEAAATLQKPLKPLDEKKSQVHIVSSESKKATSLKDCRVDNPLPGGRKATYFEQSSQMLDRLLSQNERFAPLERLIPGSKFVRINYDQKRFYVVGVIGRDYICYGVPSAYSEQPPKALRGYARWLPCDANRPQSDGFWMMYQDGVSGETLKS